VSHRLWQTRFSGAPDLVGRTLRLNDTNYAVGGIMPAGFNFPGDTDIWLRLGWDLARHSRGAHFMESVARLKPGVPIAQAQRELDALTARLSTEFTGTNRGWGARAIGLHEEVVGFFRPALFVLLAAVGLLLLIACINVASLLLARAASRAREVAVRTAIGATRQRLVRQLLTESLLLAAAGACLGVGLAVASMKGIAAMTPIRIPRMDQAAVDGRVLLFASLLTVATAIVFGLLPALFASRSDPQQVLKDGGRGQSGGRGRGRAHQALVVAEIALAVMLLVGAGLLLRSVERLTAETPGFSPAGIMTTGVQLSGTAYAQWPQVAQVHSDLLDNLREQPGVQAAGASNFLPLAPGWRVPFLIRGAPAPARGDEPTAQYHSVSDGYFDALGVSVTKGRAFDNRDTPRSRGVVMINDTLARRYFPGVEPVGQTIRSLATGIGPLGRSLMTDREHEVIGVVADVKNSSLQGSVEPALYHAQRQFPFRHMYVLARGPDPVQVSTAIRAAVRRTDPALPPAELRPMDAVIGESIDRPRFLMFLMGVFAVSALALAALGIYGLLSYAVTERQQEISIRMALGAQPAGVMWMVLRQGLTLACLGGAAGLAAAWMASHRISSFLYGIAPGDPVTLASVGALALSIALISCAVPAIRAARLDPLKGLRE
jgi:putative ABC transport system permease protein